MSNITQIYLFTALIIGYILVGLGWMVYDRGTQHKIVNMVGLFWLTFERGKHGLIILALITVAGAALRCHRLADLPPGMNEDEIKLVNEVRNILTGKYSMTEWTGFSASPRFILAPNAVAARFLPAGRAQFRAWETACGIACIPAIFFLAAEIFGGAFVPLLLAALLACLPYSLFYSRVTCGASLTIYEILALYFFLTGLRRQSLVRIGLATFGAGWFFWTYQGGRIMLPYLALTAACYLIARKMPWQWVVKCTLVSGVVMALMLTTVAQEYRRNPGNYYFHRAKENIVPASYVYRAVTNTVNMFRDGTRGVDGYCTQGNVQVMQETWFWFAAMGLLLAFTAYAGWPASMIGGLMIVSLLPSIIWSNGLGNSHRALLSLPVIILLTGYSLKACLGGRVSRVILVLIVAYWCWWGATYFCGDMWKIAPHRLKSMWWSYNNESVEQP